MYSYSSYRDRIGKSAWFDLQTNRWISRSTLVKRTKLPLSYVKQHENGRDGYGYRITLSEKIAVEKPLGVYLI